MNNKAVLLLVLSGFIHTLWNGAFKTGRNKLCFLWWMILFSLVYYSPIFWYHYTLHGIPARGFLFIGLSGTCLSLYFLSLSGAYSHSDLSLAYPISRGTSPIFVLLLATVILKERVSPVGFWGIITVAGGLYVINLHGTKGFLTAWREKGVLLALLTALFISAYRIVDKIGVGIVSPPLYYYTALMVVFCIITAVIILTGQRSAIVPEWRKNRGKILFAGAAIYLSYIIVLYVMTTSKISYVGAVANFGILFSVIWGSLALKEGRGLVRGAGALLVITGIVVIVLGG